VHAFQVSESDDAFQFGERGVARLARPEVVPRAKAWQVSMQTPTRDLSSTRSIR